MSAEFDIEERFVDKDESRFTYRERDDGVERVLAGDLPHFTKTVTLGPLARWDDGTPMTDDQRRRLIDRVASFAFARGYTSVCDANGVVRFARGEFEITVSFSGKRPLAWYSEIGRSTCVIGRTIGGDDSQRARLYLAQTTRWVSGAPVTDGERETIARRLAADPRFDLEDPAQPSDPWRLALELWNWRRCVHAIVAAPPASWEGPNGSPPPGDTLFWRVELPTICRGGNIGSSYDGRRSHLGLARIAPGAGVRVRDWLFADALPLGPVDLRSSPAETRVELWGWKSTAPPPDAAGRVLGAVVEARLSQATPAFALYADGKARYLDSDCLIAWEIPELAFATAWLRRLESAPTIPGRAGRHMNPGEVRVTLLTPAGPRTPKAVDQGFVDACAAFIRRMIDMTVPLDPGT